MNKMTNYTVSRQLEPWHELNGEVVLVTGASSGLGQELCLDLSRAGCRIIAAARRTHRLKSLCDEINRTVPAEPPPRAMTLELDVCSDSAAIEASAKQAWNMFGRIDVLINNAGITGPSKTSLDLSEQEFERVFRTNLTGSWLLSKFICILMRESKIGGSVINISSIAGLNRVMVHGGIAYGCSKAAMDTMTRTMAMELGQHKIRVNSIAPGLFRSEITEDLIGMPWLKNVVERTVPLKELGQVDPAITSLVRYLIHDSSEYVTGNIYIVDSGLTLPGVPIFSKL